MKSLRVISNVQVFATQDGWADGRTSMTDKDQKDTALEVPLKTRVYRTCFSVLLGNEKPTVPGSGKKGEEGLIMIDCNSNTSVVLQISATLAFCHPILGKRSKCSKDPFSPYLKACLQSSPIHDQALPKVYLTL